jgi:hypothetical protein
MVLCSNRMFSREGVTKRAGFPPLFLAGLLFALPETVLANLGIFSASDIQRTGNLVPIRKSKIELVSEKLTARLDAETSRVWVEYEFVNTSGDDAVTVGFPVDLMPPAGEDTSYHVDHWQKDGLRELQIFDGADPVRTERTVEEMLSAENRPKQLEDAAITRRWSIATLQFKAHETKHVRITYVVRCMGADTGFEGDPHLKFSPRTFLYTFRTAGGWGSGRVRKLNIQLDITYLSQNRFPILEMNPKIKANGEGMLRSEFKSIELSHMPDLMVRYDSTPALFQAGADRLRLRDSNWQLTNCGDGKFEGKGLTDGNPATAWMPESGKGVGICFEFQPRHDSYLNFIAILNGPQVSAVDYAAKSRIKKVRVDYVLYLEEGRKHETFEQTFRDRKFDNRSLRFPTTQADFLDLPDGPEGILEDVKLTVLEVYPGADNAPLAISEIYAFGINGKK